MPPLHTTVKQHTKVKNFIEYNVNYFECSFGSVNMHCSTVTMRRHKGALIFKENRELYDVKAIICIVITAEPLLSIQSILTELNI